MFSVICSDISEPRRYQRIFQQIIFWTTSAKLFLSDSSFVFINLYKSLLPNVLMWFLFSDICLMSNIKVYPSFKYYKNGEFIANYEGDRTIEDVIAFLNKPTRSKEELWEFAYLASCSVILVKWIERMNVEYDSSSVWDFDLQLCTPLLWLFVLMCLSTSCIKVLVFNVAILFVLTNAVFIKF